MYRALAGLNLGLLQSAGISDISAFLNTVADGCATVYRRGGDGYSVYALLKALIRYLTIYYTKHGAVEQLRRGACGCYEQMDV